MSGAWVYLVSVLLLLGNAFFVGAEFAAMAVRRSTLEPLADAGSKRAQSCLLALERLGSMLATAQARHHRVLGRPGCPRRGGAAPPARADLPRLGPLRRVGERRGPRARAAHRVLPARRRRRDDPEEPRDRRPRPRGNRPRAGAVRHRERPAPDHPRHGGDRQGPGASLRGRAQGRDHVGVHRRGGGPHRRGVPSRGPHRGGAARPRGQDARVLRQAGPRGGGRRALADDRRAWARRLPTSSASSPSRASRATRSATRRARSPATCTSRTSSTPTTSGTSSRSRPSGSVGSPPCARTTTSRTCSPRCRRRAPTSRASSTTTPW